MEIRRKKPYTTSSVTTVKSSSIKGFPCFTGTDEQRINATPKRKASGSNPLGRTRKRRHAKRVSSFWYPPFASGKRRSLRRVIEHAGKTRRGFSRIHPFPRGLKNTPALRASARAGPSWYRRGRLLRRSPRLFHKNPAHPIDKKPPLPL